MYIPPKIQIAYSILGEEYDRLGKIHTKSQPQNGSIPVGGGDWMDSFFRMEGVRGTLASLRNGNTLARAFEKGKVVSEISIRIWNQKREWQVHRWDKHCHTFLDRLQQRIERDYQSSRKGKLKPKPK